MLQDTWKTVAAAAAAIVVLNASALWFLPQERNALLARFSNAVNHGAARGFACRTHLAPDGGLHRYAVFVPYGMAPGDRLPLVVYLNGVGKNGDDGIAHLKDGLAPAIWETRGSFPFVAVFPQCPNGAAWTDNGRTERLALEIMNSVAAEFHTDPDRVFLTGLSSGAAGVWSIAANNPELFAGIVPVSTPGVSTNEIDAIAAANLPVWSFYVHQDKPHVVEANHRVKTALLARGRSPRITQIHTTESDLNMNLHDAWGYAFRNAGLMDWMWKLKRRQSSAREQYTRRELTGHPQDVSANTAPADGNPEREFEYSIGQSGRQLIPLQLSAGEMAECHFEFLAGDGVRTCGLGLLEHLDGGNQNGWTVEVGVDGKTPGGIYYLADGTQSTNAKPESMFAVYPGQWNDLRVRIDAGKVRADVNGWPVFQGTHSYSSVGPDTATQLALTMTGEAASTVKVRLLRTLRCDTLEDSTAAKPIILPDAGPTVSSLQDVTIATIEQAWRQWGPDTASSAIQWKQSRHGISRWTQFCSSIPDDTNVPDPTGTIRVARDRAESQSRWMYTQTRISRNNGLIAETSNDYLSSMGNRFQNHSVQQGRPALRVSVRDRNHRLDYVSYNDESTTYGIAFKDSDSHNLRGSRLEELFVTAPLLALAPLSKFGGNIDTSRCQVAARKMWLGGVQTVVVSEIGTGDTSTALHRNLWLDPARDFRILRMQTRQDGHVHEQIDFDYVEDDKAGWRPSSWHVIANPLPAGSKSDRFFPGNELLFDHASAEVTDWSVHTPSTGELEPPQFPPNTAFFDQPSGKWLKQVTRSKTHPLDSETVGILASGIPGANPQSDQRIWLIIPALVLVAIIAMLRRSKSRPMDGRS